MKKLYVLAALLMLSTSAHAGNSISFRIDGYRVRVDVPNHCDRLSCIRISAPDFSDFNFKSIKPGRDDDGDVATRADPPAPKAAPAPDAKADVKAPAPDVKAAAPTPPAAATTPSVPAVVAALTPAPVTNDVAPSTLAPAIPTAAPKQPTEAAPAPAPTTPLGIWATEENKGSVRIEACGQNLCGYAVKTGEKILVNMKPSDAKWIGEVRDPDTGKNYDSTIAMKDANALRIQGCAFGGMICKGETWKRVG
jgi:uncharacterized protein (DUF2147 family)